MHKRLFAICGVLATGVMVAPAFGQSGGLANELRLVSSDPRPAHAAELMQQIEAWVSQWLDEPLPREHDRWKRRDALRSIDSFRGWGASSDGRMVVLYRSIERNNYTAGVWSREDRDGEAIWVRHDLEGLNHSPNAAASMFPWVLTERWTSSGRWACCAVHVPTGRVATFPADVQDVSIGPGGRWLGRASDGYVHGVLTAGEGGVDLVTRSPAPLPFPDDNRLVFPATMYTAERTDEGRAVSPAAWASERFVLTRDGVLIDLEAVDPSARVRTMRLGEAPPDRRLEALAPPREGADGARVVTLIDRVIGPGRLCWLHELSITPEGETRIRERITSIPRIHHERSTPRLSPDGRFLASNTYNTPLQLMMPADDEGNDFKADWRPWIWVTSEDIGIWEGSRPMLRGWIDLRH